MDRTTGDMIGSVGASLSRYATIWSTGLGKSARSAELFAEDLATLTVPSGFIHGGDLLHGGIGRIGELDALVIFSASGQGREYEDAAKVLADRCGIYLVTTSADSQIIHSDHVVHGYGDTIYRFLNCPTIKQMEVARHLAEAIAVERGIKSHHQIAWAHPANAKPTFNAFKPMPVGGQFHEIDGGKLAKEMAGQRVITEFAREKAIRLGPTVESNGA